jgi:hypothetical protein
MIFKEMVKLIKIILNQTVYFLERNHISFNSIDSHPLPIFNLRFIDPRCNTLSSRDLIHALLNRYQKGLCI